jgi:hypothetical protein
VSPPSTSTVVSSSTRSMVGTPSTERRRTRAPDLVKRCKRAPWKAFGPPAMRFFCGPRLLVIDALHPPPQRDVPHRPARPRRLLRRPTSSPSPTSPSSRLVGNEDRARPRRLRGRAGRYRSDRYLTCLGTSRHRLRGAWAGRLSARAGRGWWTQRRARAEALSKPGTPGSGYPSNRMKENSWVFGCSRASTRATTCAEPSALGPCGCMSVRRASVGDSVRVAGRGTQRTGDTRSTLPALVTGAAEAGIREGSPTSHLLVS